ncbi:MAG TPA: hypothetical protein VES42_13315, partial [Pilimelia sp.]|nr:hypothetical protein [Pilimelia sp.]
SHREDVPVAGVGTVTFTGGAGASTVYAADGTGTTSYPPGTAFEGRTGGRTVRLVVAGVVTYGFAARDGTLSFRAVRSRASATVFVDGRRSGSPTPFVAGDDPATYACTGGTLVQRTALYETTLTRAG